MTSSGREKFGRVKDWVKFRDLTSNARRAILVAERKRSGNPAAELPFSLEEFREHVGYRTSWECYYCGQYWLGERKQVTLKTIGFDHKLPVSQGGLSNLSNIVVCHQVCNKAKGPMDDWMWGMIMAVLGCFTYKRGMEFIRRAAAGSSVQAQRMRNWTKAAKQRRPTNDARTASTARPKARNGPAAGSG